MVYNVSFPTLFLNFKIAPVAFSTGQIAVRWYGILIAFGFSLAFLYVQKNAKRFKVNKNDFQDVILVGLVCGIIGARLYYIAFFSGDMYFENPLKILAINQGGIAIYGGIIGGIAGGLFVAKKKKINPLAALDLASLGFLIGQSIGRWGNFFNQEAFGTQTDFLLGMKSQATGGVAVHPCFLYESVWCFLVFVFLHLFSRKYKKYDGEIFLFYIVLYGLERFFVENLRTDSLYIPIFELRISAILAALCVFVGSGILVYNYIKLKKQRRDNLCKKYKI